LYDVDKVDVMMHAMNDKDLYKHLASVDKAIKNLFEGLISICALEQDIPLM